MTVQKTIILLILKIKLCLIMIILLIQIIKLYMTIIMLPAHSLQKI